MKVIKYIPNNDEKFYEDIKENLQKKEIELEKLELKDYSYLPSFVKTHLQNEQILKDDSFKISSAPYKNLDIFLHKGRIDKVNIEAIKSAKQVIVNSHTQKALIENKLGKIDNLNIIYPFVEIEKKDKKQLKEEIFSELNISNPDFNIILFYAKNFRTNGIREFMNILTTLNEQNFVVFLVGDKEQIDKNRFGVESYQKLHQQLFLIDIDQKSYSLDDIFTIADIYILPTQRTLFSVNILKAMMCKTVVMIPSTNGASEIVDAFSIIENLNDSSTGFKLDALLQRKKDLKLIQKTNKKIAKDFTKKRYVKSFMSLIDSFNR